MQSQVDDVLGSIGSLCQGLENGTAAAVNNNTVVDRIDKLFLVVQNFIYGTYGLQAPEDETTASAQEQDPETAAARATAVIELVVTSSIVQPCLAWQYYIFLRDPKHR